MVERYTKSVRFDDSLDVHKPGAWGGERNMTIQQFMQEKGGLDASAARLSYEDRWLVFSGVGDRWVVYQRKSGRQKTKVIYAGDLGGALEILARGSTRMSMVEGIGKGLNMSVEQADVTIVALQAAFEINGKAYSFDKTAKIAARAIKNPDTNDPDVRYAADWLKSLKSTE